MEWGREKFPDGIPKAVVDQHTKEFVELGFDFEKMVEQKLNKLAHNRLNLEKIKTLHPSNPEIEKLKILSAGMIVADNPDFYPNEASKATRPKIRQVYLKTHLAVDYFLYKLVERGLGILLPMHIAEKIDKIHFNPVSWTTKHEKRQGRAITDCTDASSLHPVLNGLFTKDDAEERWGVIKHPLLSEIILKYLKLKDDTKLAYPKLQAWKMDLKGAFTLLSYRPTNAQNFALELVGDVACICLCGLFGWSATPASFQVVTRAIVCELDIIRLLYILMYVDDILGFSKRWKALEERQIVS